MLIKELLLESSFRQAESKLLDRFEQLGIEETADYLIDWLYRGRFNLSYSTLDKFEAAFYTIRSVLSSEIIQSYNRLPTMYRGMSFSPTKIRQINSGGLPIKSRIMAWTPNQKSAVEYIKYARISTGVVIKHKPKANEVILAMNSETQQFLRITNAIVANPGEAILSLPLLTITPEMVDKILI